MAILIGVLAPQYMKYVEKSRVSADKDLADSVYNACTVAFADPDVDVSAIKTKQDGKTDLHGDLGSKGGTGTFSEEVLTTLGVDDIATVDAKFKSKNAKGGPVQIYVDADGNFTVKVGTDIQVPEVTSGS